MKESLRQFLSFLRDRETERQRDRETERQRDRETERQINIQVKNSIYF